MVALQVMAALGDPGTALEIGGMHWQQALVLVHLVLVLNIYGKAV